MTKTDKTSSSSESFETRAKKRSETWGARALDANGNSSEEAGASLEPNFGETNEDRICNLRALRELREMMWPELKAGLRMRRDIASKRSA